MAKYSRSIILIAVLPAISSVHCGVEVVEHAEVVGRANGKNHLVYMGSSVNTIPGKERGSTISQDTLYFHSTYKLAYAAAKDDCVSSLGPTASLLIIETRDEFTNVTEYLRTLDETFWVGGGYDTARTTFMWENSVALGPWAPWAPAHPNSRTSSTKLAINAVGGAQFQSQLQTQSSLYICEWKSDFDEEPSPCYFDNDLVIVLDSSASIGHNNYNAALEFAVRLAVAWRDHPGNRLSVVIYSDYVETLIDMRESLSVNQIRDRIYKSMYHYGPTFTHLGLDRARAQIISNSRPVPKNIVLLTDGSSNSPHLTITAANAVKNAGIRAFAIGITQYVNDQELLTIAGGIDAHKFNAPDFHALLALLRPVSLKVCTT